MEQHKLYLKAQEEKEDTGKRAWKLLPNIQKNMIIGAGMKSDGTISDELSDHLMTILGCLNGAQVKQYVDTILSENNMSISTGLCSALNKGIILSGDNESHPKNLTPFLTPSATSGNASTNADLTRLILQSEDGNLSSEDIKTLTQQVLSIPWGVHELHHCIWNCADIISVIFGEDSKLHDLYNETATHIRTREKSYALEFKENVYFGASFLDKLHRKTHKFIQLCAGGETVDIDTRTLQFDHVLESIEEREYFGKTPPWVRVLKSTNKQGLSQYDDPNKCFCGANTPTSGTERINKKVDETCRALQSENFRTLFHPENQKGLPKPTTNDGQEICLRWHCFGQCNPRNCNQSKTHINLSLEEMKKVAAFTRHCCLNYRKFRNKRGNHSDRVISDAVAPSVTTEDVPNINSCSSQSCSEETMGK